MTNQYHKLFTPASPYLGRKQATVFDIREANKKATALKKDDWEGAIACLYEARTLASLTGEVDTFDNMLRLPVFLQQAGYFEAANHEFQVLLAGIEAYVGKELVGLKPEAAQKAFLTHLYLVKLFDKARMVFARQAKQQPKAPEYELARADLMAKSAKCAELHKQHDEKRATASTQIEDYWLNKR